MKGSVGHVIRDCGRFISYHIYSYVRLVMVFGKNTLILMVVAFVGFPGVVT